MRQSWILVVIFLTAMLGGSLDAMGETLVYKGDMELQKVSGSSCGDQMTVGKRVPVEMILVREAGKIEGYLSGEGIQIGRFSGGNQSQLEINYPDLVGGSGHRLSLSLASDRVSGELHERMLDTKDKGCNFDHAALSLIRVVDGDAPARFQKIASRYSSQQSYHLGLESFESGHLDASVPHFEEAIRLLDQTEGKNNQEVLDPCLYLSVAYCALGRFEDGYRLQDRALALPKNAEEREFLRNAALVKLLNGQVERLIHAGKFNAALSLLDNLSKKYPDLAALQASRAVILVGMKRPQEACTDLEKRLKADPKNEILQESLAWCLTQQGHERYLHYEVDQAIALYRRSFSLNPRYAESVRSLVDALLINGKSAEAETFLKENDALLEKSLGTRELNTLKAKYFRDQAHLIEKQGKLTEAEALYRKALSLTRDPVLPATELARLLNKVRRYPEAQRLLNDQRKICKDDHCRSVIDGALEKEAFMDALVRRIE